MTVEAALVKEQGVTFAVVVINRTVLNMSLRREEIRDAFSLKFGGVPTVLMAQDSNGVPTYNGRRDLVRFLANVPFQALPWKKWSV